MQLSKEVMYSTVDIADEFKVIHKDLTRTVLRLSTHGLEDEIIESSFTNKMGRTYPMYLVTYRILTMLETIYLFSGYGDSNKLNKDYTPKIKPDKTYIITDNNGLFKIGCTSNLKTRIKAIQIGNPNFIEFVAIINGGKEVESELHKRFEEYKINGEWFSINEEQIYDVVKSYKKAMYKDTLNSLLFELWHLSDSKVEFSINTIGLNKNIGNLLAVKKVLKDGLRNKDSIDEIIKKIKSIDSLCFKSVSHE